MHEQCTHRVERFTIETRWLRGGTERIGHTWRAGDDDDGDDDEDTTGETTLREIETTKMGVLRARELEQTTAASESRSDCLLGKR